MTASGTLESRIAELLLSQLDPCDLGTGVEVVHDVEKVEIEMECDLDDAAVELLADKLELDDLGTHRFERFSAPYERIEIQLDANAFLRATIEEARNRALGRR